MRVMLSAYGWLLLCSLAAAQLPPVPAGTVQIRVETFVTGLPAELDAFNVAGATDMAAVPGGSNLVIANYGGKVMLVDAVGNASATPFLDVGEPTSPTYNPDFRVLEANGFTSIAFHPDFADSQTGGYGKFYTLEAEEPGTGTPDFAGSIIPNSLLPHRQALYEYTLSSHLDTSCDATCAATKRQVIRVAQPGWHHNLGDLEFDDQGLLYVSSGDGSTSGTGDPQISDNSQLMTNIFGKILRVDPLGNNSANRQYGIPATNPFVGTAALDEIYAYGLRNPYRLDRDPVTGELYASDTGEVSIESVDRIVAGGNHGWNLKEGSFIYDKFTKAVSEDEDTDGNGIGDFADANNLVEPLFEYDRDDGRAVIGSVLYRGTDVAGLDGDLVFAEFGGSPSLPGRLFYGDVATGQMYEFVIDPTGDSLPFKILSVNHDASGELYVLGLTADPKGTLVGHVVRVFAAIDGDFNDDGDHDCTDVDSLVSVIASESNDAAYDLTNDGLVNTDDLDAWLVEGGAANPVATGGNPFLRGDATLDGTVDGEDFAAWNESKFTATAAWCNADFTADGHVDGVDLLIWNANKFTSSDDGSIPVVPESTCLWVWLAVATARVRRGLAGD